MVISWLRHSLSWLRHSLAYLPDESLAAGGLAGIRWPRAIGGSYHGSEEVSNWG